MFRPAFALASPSGPRARLSVLIFHRVLDAPDELFPGEVDARRFDQICTWIRRWFNVLALDEAVERLKQARLPSRALSITFDDGYEDNHRVALPILQRHGLSATFFVSTGFLDGSCMWNDMVIEAMRAAPDGVLDLRALTGGTLRNTAVGDAASRRRAIDLLLGHAKYLSPDVRREFCERVVELAGGSSPSRLMMTPEQVRGLRAAGMQVGAHTVSHPILARLDEATARREIASGKAALEDLLGETVTLFAYPNGRPVDDFTSRDVRLVRECGFAAAFSTAWGTATRDSDMYQLPRFTPWDRSRSRFGARLLGNLIKRE